MENINQLLAQRDNLYDQILDINKRIEIYYNENTDIKIGDLYYYDDYFYLVIKKKPTEVVTLCYPQDGALEIYIETMSYADLLKFTKEETDSNTLEDITNQLLNIKNGKEL